MSQNPGPGYGQTPPPGPPYGYPPQQGPNQPYGQPQPAPNPYGQANQPYGQSPQAPNRPYGQSPQAPNQPYGQSVQGYASTPTGAYGTPPEKKSPILGIIGLALVVICGIVLTASLWRMGGLLGQLAVDGTVDVTSQEQLQSAVLDQLGGVWAILVSGSGILGFAGWIVGIVAVATKRGRALGVVTIILGVLAPIAAFLAMAAAMASNVQ